MTISSFTWYCGTTLPGEVMNAALEAYHFEPHFHDAWSVGAIVAGCCTFSCQGTQHIARRNDLVIIPPRAVHTGGTSATALCYGMAYLETGWFDAHARRTHGAPVGLPAVVISDAALCKRWAAALTRPDLSDAQRKQAISLALLALLAKYGVRHPATPVPATGGDACAELQASMRERDLPKADVDGLARRWGMHRTTLSKRFAQRYGLPPDTWLRNWRAVKAKALIRDGVPLADVAAATGFADQAHLTRVFKRIYGAAPGALRKSSVGRPECIDGEPKG
ncbi:MAG: AraC family transcriptional regulator [Burkholderiales bacterium]|nr:AraC family transcriptional regulator [Burkholderiales bacterium]MDE2611331.1 AraC family transcriptional regulator [Burkholderiales bacterium]